MESSIVWFHFDVLVDLRDIDVQIEVRYFMFPLDS